MHIKKICVGGGIHETPTILFTGCIPKFCWWCGGFQPTTLSLPFQVILSWDETKSHHIPFFLCFGHLYYVPAIIHIDPNELIYVK